MIGLGVRSARAELRVNGHKGCGKHSLAKQVTQEIRDADGLTKRVGDDGINAEIVPDGPFLG